MKLDQLYRSILKDRKTKAYFGAFVATFIAVGVWVFNPYHFSRVSAHNRNVIHEQNQNPAYRITRKNIEDLRKQNLITEKQFQSLLVFAE